MTKTTTKFFRTSIFDKDAIFYSDYSDAPMESGELVDFPTDYRADVELDGELYENLQVWERAIWREHIDMKRIARFVILDDMRIDLDACELAEREEEPGCSAWVRLDGDDVRFLAKHVADDEWNGFARPSFCAQEAQHIADHMNELDWFSGTCEFDEEGECFLCYEDSELVERFDAIEINGELLFPIGRGSWTWILDEVV